VWLWELWKAVDKDQFLFGFAGPRPEAGGIYPRKFREAGCPVPTITPRRESILKNKTDLNAVLAAGDYDILHCHLNTLSDVGAIDAALRHGVPVVAQSHNDRAGERWITRLLHRLNQHRLPWDQMTMVAVSDQAGRYLFGSGASFTVIPNAINTASCRFDPLRRTQVRSSLGLGDKFVLGHVGRLAPQKNHRFLVDVFAELHSRRPDTALLLVGGGEELPAITDHVAKLGLQKHVVPVGEQEMVAPYLAAMDVFVFPSLYEGFGNAVLEAQASGLPCLVSDAVPSEVQVLREFRRLGLDESVATWARAVLDLPSHVDRAGAHQLVSEAGFSFDQRAREFEALYADVLGSAS
jgi:glycosyltransferase involved in cell wall biosynthesis